MLHHPGKWAQHTVDQAIPASSFTLSFMTLKHSEKPTYVFPLKGSPNNNSNDDDDDNK